jgi:hypothetical protein
LKALQLVGATADVLAALVGPEREMGPTRTDAVAEAEAELRATRAEIETSRAQADELGRAWLMAATQQLAEKIDRRRAELVRVADRGEQLIPQLEAQLVAAKAEKQREGLGRHHAAIRAFLPTLVKAVEAAAAAQVQAIQLRQQAERELGENVVAANIPHLAFAGILLPDLVLMWKSEIEKMFAPPAAAPPRPVVAVPVPARAAAPKRAIALPPAPRPVRPLRRDPPPNDGERALFFVRSGTELLDGSLAAVGDIVNMPAAQTEILVRSGAADFAPKPAEPARALEAKK